MASNLSAIGFPAKQATDMERWMTVAAQRGEVWPVREGQGGYYIGWGLANGPVLWVQANGAREMVWLNPHFESTAVISVQIAAFQPRPQLPLDGSLVARVGGAEVVIDLPTAVLDWPDYPATLPLLTITPTPLHLTGFAHELEAFPTAEAYFAAQEGGVVQPVETFLPATAVQPPEAFAWIAGQVLAAELLINAASGLLFHWAQIKTVGGEMVVVADPAVVRGVIRRQGVIRGRFWLSGRRADPSI